MRAASRTRTVSTGIRRRAASSSGVHPSSGRQSSRSISPGCGGGLSVGTSICASTRLRLTSVIIGDLHVFRPAVGPEKADTIAVVDPDRVLAGPVPLELVEAVPGKHLQVQKPARDVQLHQLPPGDGPDRLGTGPPGGPTLTTMKYVLRARIAEAVDHVLEAQGERVEQ